LELCPPPNSKPWNGAKKRCLTPEAHDARYNQMDTKKYKCPKCRGMTGVRIIYGYPGPELCEASKRGEVELGGCCLTGDDPDFKCKACRHKWRFQQSHGNRARRGKPIAKLVAVDELEVLQRIEDAEDLRDGRKALARYRKNPASAIPLENIIARRNCET